MLPLNIKFVIIKIKCIICINGWDMPKPKGEYININYRIEIYQKWTQWVVFILDNIMHWYLRYGSYGANFSFAFNIFPYW